MMTKMMRVMLSLIMNCGRMMMLVLSMIMMMIVLSMIMIIGEHDKYNVFVA